ncbi:MAG TPA: hypothetical protein VN426_02085 [Syntrophomonadaceae bacterium]|nr:hypothetical protein [Syntrophomonadaceae bacterium]
MLVMGYLGAVIGAGFASGQEIVQFFVVYGEHGLWGAVLATVLFAVSGAFLMYQAHKLKVTNYQHILARTMGSKAGKVLDMGLAIFLFLGISTMLSASGAVFYEHLYLSKTLGIMAAYILVVGLLLSGKKGLVVSYNILVPVKILLLLTIAAWAAFGPMPQLQPGSLQTLASPHPAYWGISSLLYVAYNFSLAMVVLSEYQSISLPSEAIRGAFGGGLILGVLVCISYQSLHRFLPTVLYYQVPMLYVAGRVSILAKHLYTCVLWVGILTTALANAYGFAQRFSSLTGMSYGLSLIVCMTMALPLSLQSFASLVGKIYPLFGLLGIVILGTLWLRTAKDLGQDLYYNIMKKLPVLRR